jgi:hypothetical protein
MYKLLRHADLKVAHPSRWNAMTHYRTRSVFGRYHIVGPEDLRGGGGAGTP